ncbi:serine protease inhibitor [Cyanobium sp. CH-040]|nr:serine protease inhibitor [Cyanobium sp. CH-040]
MHHRSPQPAAGADPAAAAAPGLITALAVGTLVLLAALLAPEQPQDQAAICQRHNGSVACRVW